MASAPDHHNGMQGRKGVIHVDSAMSELSPGDPW